MVNLQIFNQHKFSLLKLDDSEEELDKGRDPMLPRPRAKAISLRRLCTVLLGLLCVSGASFYAGRRTADRQFYENIHLDSLSRPFEYNMTFGQESTNATVRAWKDLFPEQGGFFKHPTLAPTRSAFSVFHQLHCLNGIREGFWTVYEAAIEGRRITDDELPMMSSTAHIRHCVDLLRNALMCQPDLTVELKDAESGGVKGFGTQHECKDWDQLMRWTEKWQTYDPDPEQLEAQAASHQV